jgi:peroxin-16
MLELYKQAQNTTSHALSLPPKWLSAYSDFIIKNASAVSQIESGLRSLTYIIPGVLKVMRDEM